MRKFRRFGPNKGYIVYFSLRMRETAVFPFPVQNDEILLDACQTVSELA